MPVTYEWVIEEVDADGDIQDVDHADTAAGAIRKMQAPAQDGNRYEWGLVRNTWAADDPCELDLRQWAYVDGGKLPDEFDGSCKVPTRFHAELRKAQA